jgi:hypothetical protein
MTSLTERLQTVDRQVVIGDTAALIDDEVRAKSGLSGVAIKGGYKVVKKLRPGIIEDAIDHLLDEFTEALDPLYEEFLEAKETESFETFIQRHDDRAANDLLQITDQRAERSDKPVLKSTYGKLRGQAEKHVKQALPGVGRLIDRHAPRD